MELMLPRISNTFDQLLNASVTGKLNLILWHCLLKLQKSNPINVKNIDWYSWIPPPPPSLFFFFRNQQSSPITSLSNIPPLHTLSQSFKSCSNTLSLICQEFHLFTDLRRESWPSQKPKKWVIMHELLYLRSSCKSPK